LEESFIILTDSCMIPMDTAEGRPLQVEMRGYRIFHDWLSMVAFLLDQDDFFVCLFEL